MKFSVRKNLNRPFLFIISFGLIATALLIATHAANTDYFIEPENGTIVTPARSSTDLNASNGAAVLFTNAQTIQKTNCMPSPHVCGFADDTNTGILSGATLTRVPSQATSGSGWTYNSSNNQIVITGNVGSPTTGLEAADGVNVLISGSNVTVQNIKLNGVHGDSTDGIIIGAATNNVTLDHCDVQGASPAAGGVSATRGWNGIRILTGASNYTVKHCNIHGFVGGIFPGMTVGNDVFIGNYVHQITCWNTIDNNSDCVAGAAKGGDHCNGWADGTGVAAGDTTSTMLVQDNTFLNDNAACASGAVSLFNDNGANGHQNAHLVVNHNFLGTAGYTIISDDQYQSPYFTYVAFTNNVFTGIGSAQPNTFRNVPPYFTWPIGATANSYHNYNCGNIWDTATYRGAGADSDVYYVSSQYPVTPCPSTLPWNPPTGWYQP